MFSEEKSIVCSSQTVFPIVLELPLVVASIGIHVQSEPMLLVIAKFPLVPLSSWPVVRAATIAQPIEERALMQ